MDGAGSTKRKLGADAESALVPVKKARTDLAVHAGSNGSAGRALVAGGPPRTSSLSAPIMLLSGHEGEIYSAKFSPSGNTLASASFDRQIFLWNTFGDCTNYAMLAGHDGAVLEVHWTADGTELVSASVDQTCMTWDAEIGCKIRRFRGHKGIVNGACPARKEALFVSGSDDGTMKLWDTRTRHVMHTLDANYPVTAVCFGASSHQVLSGGLDNAVRVWDVRNLEVVQELRGHTDTITGLSLSPDGNHVLSNAMDNTVRMWDVRPYAQERMERVFQGAQHNFEKNLIKCAWTPDGNHVGAGSADRNVYIWEATSGRLTYQLPGHKGSVNGIDFHPQEPIVLSCGSDKKIFLGELAL